MALPRQKFADDLFGVLAVDVFFPGQALHQQADDRRLAGPGTDRLDAGAAEDRRQLKRRLRLRGGTTG
ncbi:MAG: hypothetical protein O2820_21040 [Planctomycetota bacterium]|nr:hypothetical protein [Planctomycetota bacterium]MDA1251702.1 hypothetical protein [Planctomycetota bacterium]